MIQLIDYIRELLRMFREVCDELPQLPVEFDKDYIVLNMYV